jgi:5'-3' exonuclease
MNDKQIVLIDFSSIAHPVWHMAASDPNPDATSIGIIAKVRALTSGQPHAALCLDSPKSFRKEMDATYKAARESKPAPFFHQCELALEALKGDGFPEWMAEGFEADDIIASAARRAIAIGFGVSVLVVSADKDLLQLVNNLISVKSPITGNIMTPDGVKEKFGVMPNQIRDYLTLVGDASDGVVGVKGIGAKGAAALLSAYGNLDDLYQSIARGDVAGIKPSAMEALQAFQERLPVVRTLLSLREDAPIDFAQVLKERQTTDREDEIMQDIEEAMPTMTMENAQALMEGVAEGINHLKPKETTAPDISPAPAARLALAPMNGDYERQLEPQSMNQAVQLAQLLFKARLFGAYGTPEAVLSTVLSGRELGLSAMASLRAFHIVEGKPTMAADALRALVLKSGKAKYFRCTERTAERATFETQRGDDPPFSLSYTVAEAQVAGVVKPNSGWVKHSADMCIARASAKLARLIYPDVCAGLYDPNEFD